MTGKLTLPGGFIAQTGVTDHANGLVIAYGDFMLSQDSEWTYTLHTDDPATNHTSASGITNLKTDGWIPVFTGMTERNPTRQPVRHPRAPCVIRVPLPSSAPLVSSPRPLCPRAPSVISATRPSFACPVRHPRAPPSFPRKRESIPASLVSFPSFLRPLRRAGELKGFRHLRMDSRFHGNDGKRPNTATPSVISAPLVSSVSRSSPRPLCHSRVPSVISAPLVSSPSPPSVIPAKAGIHPRIPRVIPVLPPSLASGRGVERFPDTSAPGLTNLKTDGWIPVFTGMTERDPTRQPVRHPRAPCVIRVSRPSSPRPCVIPSPPSVIPAKAGIHPRIPRVIPVRHLRRTPRHPA